MAPTFTLKLGGLDLSTFLRVNPDDAMDPYSKSFIDPGFTETPFADGQPLISTTVNNREQMFPLFLKGNPVTKDQLHALIQSINNVVNVRPLLLEWKDDSASNSTFFDVSFVRFEPDFNFRRSQYGYGAGVLHVWTTGYGHTGTTRVTATANGTGVFLSVPIGSVAGDAPALLDTTIVSGSVVPSLGRIIALAPITNPSYTPRIPAASLTDAQANATLAGASGADGSQILMLPVAPTGGASGVACKVPLPNPTIAGGDNRILALVKSGIDAGVGMYALDPFGNAMGGTAVASNTQGLALVDLGVCRLPTVGFPTQPKISIYGGAIWASGAAGPAVLASPGALQINEVFCLPDKNLTLIYERNSGGSVISKDAFTGNGVLNGQNDSLGNAWSESWNNNGFANLISEVNGIAFNNTLASSLDGSHLAGLLSDSMVISTKPYIASGPGGASFTTDLRLFKESASGAYTQGRIALTAGGSYWIDLAAATNATLNTLASLALATLNAGLKYRLLLQMQGNTAFINLSRDDGGPVFIPGSAAFASIGVTGNAAVAAAGVPALGLGHNSNGVSFYANGWEVDTIPSSNILNFDGYRIDGPNADSYRTSSAGVFAGQKLVNVQRGAFPKMVPSTTSLAVICAPVDQGPANDLISAAVSVRERFTYGR